MFEVGKRYRKAGTTNPRTTPPKCVYVTDTSNLKSTVLAVAVLKYDAGAEIPVERIDWIGWEEYKEPRTITRWINVYEDLSFGSMWDDEARARDYGSSVGAIATIPITYTEPL